MSNFIQIDLNTVKSLEDFCNNHLTCYYCPFNSKSPIDKDKIFYCPIRVILDTRDKAIQNDN
jgi:hypothetical protein